MKRWIAWVMVCVVAAAVNATASTRDRQKALDKVNFVAYQGPQLPWPTGDQPMPKIFDTKFDVVIYRGLPGKPYEIMGVIQITSGGKVTRRVSQAARAAGADAVLVCANDAFVKAGITAQPGMVLRGDKGNQLSSLTGFLIRWKLGVGTSGEPPANGPAGQPASSP